MLRTLLVVGRNFRPITPFLTVFLVEEKGFSTQDIVNQVIPCWLYSMLVFSILIPILVSKIGLLNTIFLSVCGEIVAGLSLSFSKRRSLFITVFAEVIIAFRSSVIVADKRYYGENDSNRTVKYSTIRKVTGIVSSFISQNMYHISGSSLAAMYVTVSSQVLVLVTTLMLPTPPSESVAEPFSLKILSVGLISKIFSYLGAFTLSSCFKIYVDLVLIDRTQGIEETGGVLRSILDRISFLFYAASLLVIEALGKVSSKIQVQKTVNRNKALHGYMEGLTKIVGVGLAVPLVKYTSKSYVHTEILCVVSWYMQIVGMAGLKKSSSVSAVYASYLISFLGSSITLYISYNSINAICSNQVITVMSYIGGVSCGAHAIIDFISRKKKIRPESRFAVYAKLGKTLFLCSAFFSALDYYHKWKMA